MRRVFSLVAMITNTKFSAKVAHVGRSSVYIEHIFLIELKSNMDHPLDETMRK